MPGDRRYPIGAMSDLSAIKTYLINLDGAGARRARMMDRLAAQDLKADRIAAVDGRTLCHPHPDFSDLSYRFLHGRRWSPAELGCYLSHLEAAQRLLDSGAEHALILEDDVTFAPDFRAHLAAALERSDLWDILRLSTVNSGRAIPVAHLAGGARLGIALSREKGAGAYVINRRAAEWLVRQRPMRLAYDILFDLEYLAGLRAVFLLPLPCDQRAEETTQIQSNIKSLKITRWRYLTVLPFRSFLEISRVVLRGARIISLRWTEGARPRDRR